MLSLDKVVAGAKVRGLAGAVPVEVVRTEWIGADALNVVYRGADGPAELLLFRDAEPRLELVQATRAFSFDGDGETFRIASEAQRIRLAHLFDPYLAVHSSRIDPLPHQITAVYGELLPRQPLRFLLADDPGAGKTIMAGLLIKELIIRGDLERCLIIAPGNLVEQWQDELKDKFDLTFDIVSREQIETSVRGTRSSSAADLSCVSTWRRDPRHCKQSYRPPPTGTSSSAMKLIAWLRACSAPR
jgi:SNF2 family DNA or RNA helicase